MSRVLVIYRQRLGDVIGCLPAAAHLAAMGHEVDFYCEARYHSIFRCVDYCRFVDSPEAGKPYDKIYNLEITRGEYDAYRASGLKWRHYIYGKYPELAPARDTLPRFNRQSEISSYGLPENYSLAAPYGVSQVTRVNEEWLAGQCRGLAPGPWFVLTDRPERRCSWATPLCARSLDHLPALIAGAAHFVTINSAANIIAAGVRRSYHQVHEPGFGGQDNYDAPGQIVLHQPASVQSRSWRFWVHYARRKLTGVALKTELDS